MSDGLKEKIFSSEMVEEILNSVEYNVSILTPQMEILWANENFLNKLGMKLEDVKDKKCYTLWHRRTAVCEDCAVVKAFKTGKKETCHRISSEQRHWILTGIPFKENNKVVAVVELGKEITEKAIVDERYKEVIQFEGMYEFIENLAHNFKNIFSGISGFAQLLQKHINDETIIKYLKNLIISVEKGTKLINSLLALKKKDFAPIPFDLNYLIISMESILKNIVGERIRLKLSLMPEPAIINADPLHIREVLLELVRNSRDFIKDEGEILITTEKVMNNSEQNVILKISDNGEGMDEITLQRCFEPLFTTNTKKFGLGLSIVQNIINKNNGKIHIESKKGAGTIVIISFTPSPSEKLLHNQNRTFRVLHNFKRDATD